MSDPAALAARLDSVRDRIARAARRVGRDPASIKLVAVSKTFPADLVRAAAAAGQVDFGENKVQEALQKMDATVDLPLTWHLIGHLQSNKARKAGARFDVVHSLDAADLLEKLEASARDAGRSIRALVQVDLSREPTRHGASPADLDAIFDAARRCTAVRVTGLMLLTPAADHPEQARPYFKALVTLRDELVARGADPAQLRDLSMGMSHDFEVAVEEGATLVRVGSAIFGERQPIAAAATGR